MATSQHAVSIASWLPGWPNIKAAALIDVCCADFTLEYSLGSPGFVHQLGGTLTPPESAAPRSVLARRASLHPQLDGMRSRHLQ